MYGDASIAVIVRALMLIFRGEVKGGNPSKIVMGVPHILGLLERGCQNLGVPIFFMTPACVRSYQRVGRLSM